jgi:SlyX protein
MNADRIDDLETHLAHLSRTVEELSDVVARQDRTIGRLMRALEGVLEREAERDALSNAPAASQKPPHW